MLLSVIMTLCVSEINGSMSCVVSGRVSLNEPAGKTACTEYANAAVNNRLLASGREGFAAGFCTNRSDYVAATREAVKYLKREGYDVTFQVYEG